MNNFQMKVLIFLLALQLVINKSETKDPFNKIFYRKLNTKQSTMSIHDRVNKEINNY